MRNLDPLLSSVAILVREVLWFFSFKVSDEGFLLLMLGGTAATKKKRKTPHRLQKKKRVLAETSLEKQEENTENKKIFQRNSKFKS